ncbi:MULTISPECIES: serine hydrolase [unclassified Achromobacter]|uniref:serine hydrolase domain-containing protein n=1 Tax=unclassified Achromobacter TaxID=2626865 RepID=UPI000B517CBB|nr:MULTISPECIES: serine hydrolase [unclassified Achromobacter]OWT74723.1 serine hydrolase [Achromobacter sp. HZ34]OWT79190.1 serine hydrolase [Achromobacter sp. HZ28]
MNDTSNPSLAQAVQHLPRGEDFLLWPPCLQSYGYRIVDRLFATRTIARGPAAKAMPRAAEVRPGYTLDGQARDVAEFMDRNNVAGLLAIHRGHIILERYGLGFRPEERWSTMSTVKSMTAMLVGAALHDGAIASLDDPVTRYVRTLAGCAYEDVTVRHLLTMSSGIDWREDYTDKQSHVNRYSKSLADKVPGGVLALLRSCPRGNPAGAVWQYNTGDTYLLGAVLSAATGGTLADYMSKRIWQPCGMEFDGFYTLESDDGQEIGGSRAGMSLRDIGRFAQFVLDDGVVDGRRILPEGWVEQSATPAFEIPADQHAAQRRALDLRAYGYSWWLRGDGAMMAMGHSGQRIFIDRAADLVVVQLAAYPEPRYVSANEPDRDAELNALIGAIRTATAG